MTELPIRFPQDPYCRAGSRLLLTQEGEPCRLYLGVTPDGVQPGRDLLVKLQPMRGEAALPCTAAQEDGVLTLRCEGGCVRLALEAPDRLLIEGEGVSLLLGKGKALGMFMSGGSALDDPLPGALYVNAGVRMRIVPRVGSVEVRSAWDLNALSDPDPRIYLNCDARGRLEATVDATDFDEPCAAEMRRPAEAAAETRAEFARFCDGLTAAPASADALRAAYIAWSALQPVRALADSRLTAPVRVSDRRHFGTGLLSDNVLFAAFLRDADAALSQLGAFLGMLSDRGLLPRAADNRSRLPEAELPMFGVVYRARPDLIEATGAALYARMGAALAWWERERFCPERGLFFYRHRYEPGCGRRAPFTGTPPEFAPELNACLWLWLDALSRIAAALGRSDESAGYAQRAQDLAARMRALLWDGSRWRSRNGADGFEDFDRGGCFAALVPALANLPAPLPETLPRSFALPLLLAGDDALRAQLAARETARAEAPLTLRGALTLLAADAVKGGRCDAV